MTSFPKNSVYISQTDNIYRCEPDSDIFRLSQALKSWFVHSFESEQIISANFCGLL